jgi:hypothetical protein
VIVEQNHFSPIFFDEKNAGIQIVMHGERIATDGEVRLNPTPEQWDPVPIFGERTLGEAPGQIVVRSSYPEGKAELSREGDPRGWRLPHRGGPRRPAPDRSSSARPASISISCRPPISARPI